MWEQITPTVGHIARHRFGVDLYFLFILGVIWRDHRSSCSDDSFGKVMDVGNLLTWKHYSKQGR